MNDANAMVSVVRGDALHLPLADASVDLVVTSPPYFSLRSYQDDGAHYEGQVGSEDTPQDFLEALWTATREMVRVLKPTGSVFVNLGDKYTGSGGNNQSGLSPKAQAAALSATGFRGGPRGYNKAAIGGARPKSLMGLPWRYALGCVDDLGLILRAELIWSKPNGIPESVVDRVRRSHETWFHFTKQGQYFASIDPIRNPSSGYERGRVAIPEIPGQRKRAMLHASNPKGSVPPSVWTIPTEPLKVPEHLQVSHFAAFPTEWPRRLILGWSPEGGTVLDPFGGTGTTALVARALGRNAVSVDLSHDYCELARWRINESGHGSKAIGRTWKERQEGLAV